ncbi:MAG: DUF1211 domain-containing protein [Alphaproteobacteria bacterium]|nr:DUF1211 domain-containing protein [Alphaproteobacteria bacterium]
MIRSSQREFFKPERLLAFSDGVFAIAVTLLVLDLRLPPEATAGGDAGVAAALLAMWPKLLIFAFTFIVIGIGWLGHHRKFSYIHKVDSGLLWLNLLYLLSLCLVPFATSLLSDHSDRISFVVYSCVMALVMLLAAGLSAYGLRVPYLAATEMPPGARQDMILSPSLTGVIFLASAALAAADRTSFAHWALVLIVPVSAWSGSRAPKRS